jgi:hypothetical protein
MVVGAALVALGAIPSGWLGSLNGLGGSAHLAADVAVAVGAVVLLLGLVGMARRPARKPGYHLSPLWRLYDRVAQGLDHRVGWDRLPKPLGLLMLLGLRNILRQRNLNDTSHEPSIDLPPLAPPSTRYQKARTPDGSYNDLTDPRMGMAGARFGRNVPLDRTVPDPDAAILLPNPRTVSQELLTRETLQPATTINMLAAAWIQFMVHDWVSHGIAPNLENPWEVPLADDDPWPQHPMRIMRAHPDPTRPPGPSVYPPTHANYDTHWWDVSQVYGSDDAMQAHLRTGEVGKLRIGADGRMAFPDDPRYNLSLQQGWWLGLELMTTIFTLEHNAICERLHAAYPGWSDDELFDHARLVNAALTAKIHTIEWTPALIAHPTTEAAMRANWYGLQGERLHRWFGRLSSSEAISGIPGSKTDHFGVPYALTEEFVAVYRMHPLILDDYRLRAAADNHVLLERSFPELTGPAAHEVAQRLALGDLFYTFGTEYPGAITLHNFPRSLQHHMRPDGILMDLAAVDILRTRELGVPRYNEFRRLLHLKPAKSFEALTGRKDLADELWHMYGGDIERVDLMIGLYAERKPRGFAFSDTAFRIFILMASRRLNSDRFFTRDYTPEVYSREGLRWIRDNTMVTVLLRHYPELALALRGVKNAFRPWSGR